jgi:hypothetical protein
MSIEDKFVDEIAKLAPEVYKDLVKPAALEVGSLAGRSARALLSPVRAFLWSWEKIEVLVVDGVQKRLEKIPEEQRRTPDPEIAVPLIQSLTYTAQNETLREMYLNLLANAMNVAMDKRVHPSFVQLIKQMSTLDAKVFHKLAGTSGYQRVTNPNVVVRGQAKIMLNVTPEWFIGWKIDGYDIFEISASILRLGKFGLIELMFDRTAGSDGYAELINHSELLPLLRKSQEENPSLDLELSATKSIIYVNEYGKQFTDCCS